MKETLNKIYSEKKVKMKFSRSKFLNGTTNLQRLRNISRRYKCEWCHIIGLRPGKSLRCYCGFH